MMSKRLIKRFLNAFYRPLVVWFLKYDHLYHFQGLDIAITAGVFHPGLFFSTKLLIRHLNEIDLTAKRFLELGAGTGLISMIAARRNALVTASDVSLLAISNVIENARRNQLAVRTILSDLFNEFSDEEFDVIIINPPYYPSKVAAERDYAWCCGENFEYFLKLFAQLNQHVAESGIVRMILSEDCQIERVREIARSNEIELQVVVDTRVLWERNQIFDIRPIEGGWHES